MNDQDPNILDLDALLPEPKKIKINNKIIDAYPPTILQLLEVQKIANQITDQKLQGEEAILKLKDVVATMVPAVKTDPSIDFTMDQLIALIQFMQNSVIPASAVNAKDYPVEKKTNSLELSPSSSETTPATQ